MSNSTALVSQQHTSFNLWHWRLGHPSLPRLLFLSKTVDDIFSCSHSTYDVCHLAKHTKLPFPHENNRCNEPFGLILVDVWGDLFVTSIFYAHYFLTTVDDFSRCTWIYLMKNKFDTQFLLKNFFFYGQNPVPMFN